VLTRPMRGPSLGTYRSAHRSGRSRRRPLRPVLISLCILHSLAATFPAQASQPVPIAALFAEAVALKEAGACDEAVVLFGTVTAQTADDPTSETSDLLSYSLYNAGVCLEELGFPEAARDEYDELLRRTPHPDDLLPSALFRRALLDVVPGTPTKQARKDLLRTRRLEKGELERAQVDLQLARLDSLSKRPHAALRRVLRAGQVLERMGDDLERDRRGAPLDWYRAEAALIRGTLWLDRASQTQVGLNPRRSVSRRMEQRAHAMSQAEGHLALAAGLPFRWAPQALHDLGQGWRQTSEALHALWEESQTLRDSNPNDLEVTVLATWLETRVPSQFRKAAQSWELCVQSSQVLGVAPDIAKRCQAQLDTLVGRPELQPQEDLKPPTPLLH